MRLVVVEASPDMCAYLCVCMYIYIYVCRCMFMVNFMAQALRLPDENEEEALLIQDPGKVV